MAGSLLLPLVRGVASKAASVLVQTVTRMCGLDDDRDTLQHHLLAVESKLASAEERSEADLAVKMWMKKLKVVAYEADDVLDEFEYEALRRKYQIGESKKRKVLSYITHHSPLPFRFAMSTKLKNILQKIKKLVEEMNMFGLENSARVEEPRLPFRLTHSKLDEFATIYGRDDDMKVIKNLLLDQRDQREVQVLPIFGMGGLGKTTLAKMVYNDQGIQQHFQLKMWHCVSDNFDVIALVKSIIELATNGRCNLPDNMELLQRRLEEVIGKKRFLLVLDDVWNEDERKWEDDLKPLLCSVGGPGSVIVVTCRSQKVASVMQTLEPHKLACLNEEHSWELFAHKAFSSGVEEQAELVTIGSRIVKKCRGLPLALKTLGGLLSSYEQVQEWKAIEESNIGGKDEILPILKLSYKHLSSEMKQYFAFCAVFHKDVEMDKDNLIELWIANGFIQEEGMMDLTQKGELIFQNLVWRSFLQDLQVYPYGLTNYESITCKMHDLMHDLAKDVTDECASIEELNQQKALLKDVCHIQTSQAELKQIRGLFKGKTHLHYLLVSATTSNKNLKELLQVSVSIRALSLRRCSIMNHYITDQKHLRYLDISFSDIVALPDSICLLYNLQTLRLVGCRKLLQLPEDMIRLRNLIYLYLSGCECLESMPPNFGLMNKLHILTTFVVGTGDGLGIEQLKDLKHLGNRLVLLNLNKVKSGENAKEANLHQKYNLKGLVFCWAQETDDDPKDKACSAEEVLQCLEPHSNIENLEIDGYGGLEISRWMRKPEMFNCLRELNISNCPRCKNIPVVWLSVSLQVLRLSKMDKLTTLCNNLDVEAGGCITAVQTFPKLKEMRLIDLPSLETWAKNSVGEASDRFTMFPMLEKLHIENCPKLASVPVIAVIKVLSITGVCSTLVGLVSMSILVGSWPFLVRLTVESENNMDMLPLDVQQSESPRTLEELKTLILEGPNCFVAASDLSGPNLTLWQCFGLVEELHINRCNNLVHWSTDQLRCLDRLRSLTIAYCDNLEGTSSSSEETLPLSVEELSILYCKSVVALPSNLGDLAKLRILQVSDCINLKVLPDGMDGLTSLELLGIYECPGIEEFPHGLLQRLPDLKSLRLYGCFELERRCRQGGEYFHMVSSIPRKLIGAEAPESESSRKKFLRRLLPSCANTKSDGVSDNN